MKRKWVIIFLLILSSSVVFFCQRKALFDRYVFQDDSNQYIFPYYRITNPQFFHDDIFCEYSLRYNTKGVVLIYTFFSKFIDPLLFSKILPFALCFFAAVYVFLIGEKIKDTFVGLLAAVTFIMHSWTFSCFAGGQAKAFVFPMLLSFIYHLMRGNYSLAAIILFLQIFVYPPIAAVSIFSLLLLSLRVAGRFGVKISLKREASFFILLAMAGTLSLYFLYLRPDSFKGPLFSLSEIMNMPEFHSRGRDPHFIASLTMLKEDHIAENITGLPVYSVPTWFLLAISAFGFILISMRKINIHPVLNAFCFSGVMLFFAAWIMFFRLYSPGRYLKFAPLVFLIFLSALIIDEIFVRAKKSRIVFFLLPLIVIASYWPFLKDETVHFRKEGLYNFLSTLPADALIAGHPEEMDEIPLIAKRKVFVQFELSLPYYKNYYKKIKERTRDFFRLYYSGSGGEAVNICNRHHIDYVVIKKGHFLKTYLDQQIFYIEPFNDEIRQIVAGNIEKGFVFKDVPREYRVYEDKDFFVVSMNGIAFL